MLKRAVLICTLLLAPSPLCAQAQPSKAPANSTVRTPQKDVAEEVFLRAASKIVFLITRKLGELHSRASGVILSTDGYIATNYHALQGADAVEIRFFPDPGDSEDYQSFNGAKLLYADPDLDIAVLKVNSNSLPFLKCPANSGCKARVGERVYAIGNPKGLSNTISEGIVSGLRSDESEQFIQHTAPISPGSSGGALVDSTGALLGMNSWQVADAQNLNFAISAKHLLAALASARLTATALSFPPEGSTAPAENGPHIEDWVKAEIAQLRSIVQKIEACPQEKTESSVASVLVGPPYNVTWDVVAAASESVRAPYTGYIELVVPYRVVVVPEACKRLPQSCESNSPVILRYLYDLGPVGLDLVKVLQRHAQENRWLDRVNWDSLAKSSCWEKAAQPSEKVGARSPSVPEDHLSPTPQPQQASTISRYWVDPTESPDHAQDIQIRVTDPYLYLEWTISASSPDRVVKRRQTCDTKRTGEVWKGACIAAFTVDSNGYDSRPICVGIKQQVVVTLLTRSRIEGTIQHLEFPKNFPLSCPVVRSGDWRAFALIPKL